MRVRALAVLAALSGALLVALPLNVTPASAATAARSLACYPPSSLCSPQAALIVAELGGVVSGGGATAATGAGAASGAVAGGAAAAAGVTGVKTIAGGGMSALGLLGLAGLGAGMWFETDPNFTPEGAGIPAGFDGPTSWEVSSVSSPPWGSVAGSRSVTVTAVSTPDYGATSGTVSVTVNWGSCPGSGFFAQSGGDPALVFTRWVNASGGAWGSGTLVNYNNVNGSSQAALCQAHSGTYTAEVPAGGRMGTVVLGNGTVYYPTGHPSRPAGGEEEPGFYNGTVRATVTCVDGASSTYVEKTLPVVDVPYGNDLPVPAADCPPGTFATFVQVDWLPSGATSWAGLWSAAMPTPAVDLYADYIDCFGPTGPGCELELVRVGTGGLIESCGPAAIYCPNWVQQWQAEPQLYQCKYGPHAISIDFCSAFRDPKVGVLPNWDGEEEDGNGKPKPLPPTAAIPDPLPNPVRDPVSGDPLTELPPEIRVEEGQQTNKCFPTGWGILNPVEWVMKPVQCALEWAFVPRVGFVSAKTGEVKAFVNGTWLAVPVGVITGMASAVDIAASGCQGPPLHIEAFGVDETYYPFNACDEPMAGVASAVNGLLSFSVSMLAGMAIVRYIMGVVGFGPFGTLVARSAERAD